MYFCGECKEECTPKPIDEGLGRIEVWGAIYNDSRPNIESNCCNAEVYENEECTIEASYADWAYDQECDEADHEYDTWRDRMDD